VHIKPEGSMHQKPSLNIQSKAWNNGVTAAGISC